MNTENGDVGESLRWIKRYSAPTVYGISEAEMESKIRKVRFAFRSLRERLEEVEERAETMERDADIEHRIRRRKHDDLVAARRREDRLEEAVKEALDWLGYMNPNADEPEGDDQSYCEGCKWRSPEHGGLSNHWPYEINPHCPVHGAESGLDVPDCVPDPPSTAGRE